MEERIQKALDYIANNLDKDNLFPSFISQHRDMSPPLRQVKEYFTTALVAMTLGKNHITTRILDHLYSIARQRLLTFYPQPVYPPDTDTNSLVISLLLSNGYNIEQQANHVLELIKKFSVNGVAGVWLSNEREQHLDPIVSINAQILATLLGKKQLFPENLDFISNHLLSGSFVRGTRYYHSPDTFLYFVARLADFDPDFNSLINKNLTTALSNRIGTTCHPLDLAQRVIIGKWLGMDISHEIQKLLSLQRDDGCLPNDSIFRLGSGKGFFGSPALTTAFFIQALNIKTHEL